MKGAFLCIIKTGDKGGCILKQVTLYTKENCPLCDEAKQLLLLVKQDVEFSIQEVDIYNDDALLEKYQLMIPVVEVDGEVIDYGQVNFDTLFTQINE